jgi:alpha-glucosidase
LLKEYYKHFIQQRGVGTIFRPLFFEFPADMNVYDDKFQQTQFLIGKNLMVAPIVTKGATNRSVYFPQGDRWFGYRTGR